MRLANNFMAYIFVVSKWLITSNLTIIIRKPNWFPLFQLHILSFDYHFFNAVRCFHRTVIFHNPYDTGTAMLFSLMPDSNIRQWGNIPNGSCWPRKYWRIVEPIRGREGDFYRSCNSLILISGSLQMRPSGYGGTSETLAPAGKFLIQQVSCYVPAFWAALPGYI